MAKLEKYTITRNDLIARDTYLMNLKGDTSWIIRAGKFINISIDEKYLKRPISIADYNESSLTIIYKVVGEGTKIMSRYPVNKEIEALVNLGNGFEVKEDQKHVLIIGGGVGVPPLYPLARQCVMLKQKVTVVLGFQSKDDAFYIDEFRNIGAEVYISTNDGSLGSKGYVTDIIRDKKLSDLYYYTCGPLPMLKGIHGMSKKGQLSFEERMGCGFGACMGCSHKTKFGYKRICVEGPILDSEEVLWES